jgi:hypothetical protein
VRIDASSVEFVVMGHVDIACSSSQVADLFVASVEGSRKLVDVCTSGCELLGSNIGASFDSGGKSVGDGPCDFTELISTEADESFGRARG